MAKNLAEAMDSLPMLMSMPIAIRKEWLKHGFSETAAEQAAMAMWMNLMGLNNNG